MKARPSPLRRRLGCAQDPDGPTVSCQFPAVSCILKERPISVDGIALELPAVQGLAGRPPDYAVWGHSVVVVRYEMAT